MKNKERALQLLEEIIELFHESYHFAHSHVTDELRELLEEADEE